MRWLSTVSLRQGARACYIKCWSLLHFKLNIGQSGSSSPSWQQAQPWALPYKLGFLWLPKVSARLRDCRDDGDVLLRNREKALPPVLPMLLFWPACTSTAFPHLPGSFQHVLPLLGPQGKGVDGIGLHIHTTGWMASGFSPRGELPGSDIMTRGAF